MRTSDKGVNLIKSFEGLRLKAYKAVPTEKYWTIGYGHYGADVSSDMVISEKKAVELLRQDLRKSEGYVERRAKARGLVLDQNQFDALVSFTFNCGLKNLNLLTQPPRTLEEIGNRLTAYNKAGGKVLGGLVRRRKAEQNLFFGRA